MHLRSLALAVAAAVSASVDPAATSVRPTHVGTEGQTAKVPARIAVAAPPARSLEPLAFDVVAIFRIRVGRDGSIHDIILLDVKPADDAVRDPVPTAVASRAISIGRDSLRRWRYAEGPDETHLRVSFLFPGTATLRQKNPKKVIGVEACVPERLLGKPPAVLFSAKFGGSQQLEDVSVRGGPEHLHDAARTLVGQWVFQNGMGGTNVSSVIRFFPPDCTDRAH